MKKRNLLLSLILLCILAVPASADSLESVRVVKYWDDSDDTVIERASGERLLIQHNHTCSTMSTEFPVKLVWEGDEVVRLKINVNEQCDVNNWAPYTNTVKIHSRISTTNALVPEHEAEIDFNGKRYEIDYGEGCKNLRYYLSKPAYVNAPNGNLEGGTLYLPKARGFCSIKSAKFLEELELDFELAEDDIERLIYKAENNQVYFTWDAFPAEEKWVIMSTHSKYRFDPNELETNQLPKLNQSRGDSLRVLQLVNGKTYYFYIRAVNGKGEKTHWKELVINPVGTIRTIENRPDPEEFEIEMEEADDAFLMTWPDKAEDSKRYLIQIYVDGKREVFKIIQADESKYVIERKPEWAHSRFRMTVRSLPKTPYGKRFFDSIFWRKG